MALTASAFAGDTRTVRKWSFARRVWCDAGLPAKLVEALCSGDVDSVLYASTPLQVKDRCVVARRDFDSKPLLVKRHSWGGLSRTLRMAFREPAALSCARYGIYLDKLGIRTPRPRATVNFRIGPWSYWSYLVTDYIDGVSLYRYIRFGTHSPEELRHVARQVAQIWQRLVDADITHNDFKLENFIIDEQRNVWLIDLEKMRVGGDDARQRQRHIFDATNFLHVRGWHGRAEARAVFANALLDTPYGDWMKDSAVTHVATGLGLHEAEKDTALSVLIVCEDGINKVSKQAIDSVRDIADEVVLVQRGDNEWVNVLKRIDFFSHDSPAAIDQEWNVRPASIARSNWILALRQNETVTPFLAKELQQQIADAKLDLAFQIPIERLYFGHTISNLAETQPIRLFRQPECTLSIADGEISVTTKANERVRRLTGTIQSVECATIAEYVDCLNSQSTIAALRRHLDNERPRLLRSALRAASKFLAKCADRGGIRSGWAGVQLAALECAFRWVEEMKLHQLASEFHRAETDEAEALLEAAKLSDGGAVIEPSTARAA